MARTFRKFEKREKPRKLKKEQTKKYLVKRKAILNQFEDEIND